MYATIAILLLVAIFCNPAVQEEEPFCKTTNITCGCGIGIDKHFISVELKTNYTYDLDNGKSNCFAVENPQVACSKLDCFLLSNESERRREILPISHPRIGASHRITRDLDTCRVPFLNNATINCSQYENWTGCEIKCLYGYAFMDGNVTKKIHCRPNENIWKEHGFIDCQPYMNCDTLLVEPGTMNCTHPLDAPAICEIYCHEYEDKKEVKIQKYECDNENFGSILPHCVVLDKTVILAPKPSKPVVTSKLNIQNRRTPKLSKPIGAPDFGPPIRTTRKPSKPVFTPKFTPRAYTTLMPNAW